MQLQLQANQVLGDLNRAEFRQRQELFKLLPGVRAFEQHKAERQLGDEPVDCTQPHAVDGRRNRLRRRILPQIDDEGAATGLEHAIHFLQSLDRLGEVLERGSTKQEIERLIREWHAGRISLSEIDIDSITGRFLPSDVHEGLANVKSGDAVIAALRQLDREVPGPRRYFEYIAAGWNLCRDAESKRLELVHCLAG